MTAIPRPTRNCTHPGCHAPQAGRGLCAAHREQKLAHLHASVPDRRERYGAGWKQQRERVLDRDGSACVYCGATTRLEVHHLVNQPRVIDAALVTLCYRHHRAIEAEVKRGEVGKVGTAVKQWMEHAT